MVPLVNYQWYHRENLEQSLYLMVSNVLKDKIEQIVAFLYIKTIGVHGWSLKKRVVCFELFHDVLMVEIDY